MVWSIPVRRPVTAVAVLVVTVLGGAAPAQAQAVIEHFDETHTDTYSAPLEGCLPPDLIGTVTSTEHSVAQAVRSGPTIVITGVNKYDFHMDLPDGRYVQSGVNQEEFAVVLHLPNNTVSSFSSQDERTIHAADGTVIGTLAIHEDYDVIYRDLNLNEEPDPGEVTLERHEFQLTCGMP